MDFEWDEAKSEWTRRNRGFDFERAARIFARPVQSILDERRDYGERRVIAIGETEGEVLVVVYTDREDVQRIISARRASRREAIVRKSLNEIMATDADQVAMDSISDQEIRRQIAEDPDTAPELTVEMLSDPANLRRRLAMTQERFAVALGVPVSTVRKWERGDGGIDAAAQSLLILVARDPEGAVAALAAARAAA